MQIVKPMDQAGGCSSLSCFFIAVIWGIQHKYFVWYVCKGRILVSLTIININMALGLPYTWEMHGTLIPSHMANPAERLLRRLQNVCHHYLDE